MIKHIIFNEKPKDIGKFCKGLLNISFNSKALAETIWCDVDLYEKGIRIELSDSDDDWCEYIFLEFSSCKCYVWDFKGERVSVVEAVNFDIDYFVDDVTFVIWFGYDDYLYFSVPIEYLENKIKNLKEEV